MAKDPKDARFLGGIAVTFAGLSLCWVAMSSYMPTTFPVFNQSEANWAEIAKYELSPVPPVVLTGTSLMRRIEPEFFTSNVANISLAGGSAVTSASIGATKNPPVLVVEVNILDRQASRENVPFTGIMTTPVRAAVALSFDLDKKVGRQSAKLRDEVASILTSRPADPVSDEGIVASFRSWEERPLHAELNRQSAIELMSIADEIESHGGRVVYLLLPVHPVLETSPYYRRGRDFLRSVDPNFNRRFLSIDWSDEIRWESDGAHVDRRSAILIARQIEAAIAAN